MKGVNFITDDWDEVLEKHICIDLCSGKEGFSSAFKNDYEVITIDMKKKFKPKIQADVCHLPLKENLQPDVLLASPPCTHFSVASGKFPKKGIQKAMEIVGACFEAVNYLNPKKYLIENPRGYLRCLTPIKPKQTIRYSDFSDYPTQKPTDLWGNIPIPMVQMIRRPSSPRGSNKIRNAFKTAADRAQIPLDVSLAVKQGVES